MAHDDKLIITPAEAEGLLEDGEYVHNYISGGSIMIGCDYDRAGALKAFADAKLIEIGGPGCKAMRHPIAVWASDDKVSFFAADMAKVEAFEAARAAIAEATASDPKPEQEG